MLQAQMSVLAGHPARIDRADPLLWVSAGVFFLAVILIVAYRRQLARISPYMPTILFGFALAIALVLAILGIKPTHGTILVIAFAVAVWILMTISWHFRLRRVG